MGEVFYRNVEGDTSFATEHCLITSNDPRPGDHFGRSNGANVNACGIFLGSRSNAVTYVCAAGNIMSVRSFFSWDLISWIGIIRVFFYNITVWSRDLAFVQAVSMDRHVAFAYVFLFLFPTFDRYLNSASLTPTWYTSHTV